MNIDTIKQLLSGIQNYILPLGFFFFLTGILFFNSVSAYHTQIYLFLILPSLILSIFKGSELKYLLFSHSFQLLLFLFIFISLSFFWNNPEVNDFKYFKKLLIILTFIVAFIHININNNAIIIRILLLTSMIYAIAGLYSMIDLYLIQKAPILTRMIGYGNLSNPLLSSHIYGVFTVFIVGYYIISKKTIQKSILIAFIFISLLCFVILTQSRTAILGLAGAFLVLLLSQRDRKTLYIAMITFILISIFIAVNIEIITSRGLNYRPELWMQTVEKISLHPIIGYGIGSELLIYIEDIDMTFSEPHNIHLGLTYFLGCIGLIIWLLFLIHLFKFMFTNKNIPLALIGGLMLSYGIMAGITEGSNIFTRPKEIWFLTWLPIGLILTAEFSHTYLVNNHENEISDIGSQSK